MDKLDRADRATLEARITDARAEKIDIENYRNLNMQQYVNSFAWRRYLFNFLGDVREKLVLDVCCGYSMTPVLFALSGARVVANDVAPLTLERVGQVAELNGVSKQIEFYCGPAEEIPYPDKTFDIIYGGAAIHHLQIPAAGQELSRVLKAGGRGGFQDPLGHNVFLEFARDNLNYINKHPEKGTDRPLRIDDIKTFGEYFTTYQWRGFDMVSMAARLIPRIKKIRRVLEGIDHTVFITVPWLQRYARFAVTLVSN
jgi:ubiquinone/menaquinone biosynthesis C-methylase UbiE